MVTTESPETRNYYTTELTKNTYGWLLGRGSDALLFSPVFFSMGHPKTVIEPITFTTSGSAAVFNMLPIEQTNAYYYDREMYQLERAVMVEDEIEFVRLLDSMDWQIRAVEDYLKAVKLALQVGAHLAARKLSQEGGERFPENPEMVKHAKVLAPVKTIRSDLPFDPGVGKNNLWLKQHQNEYHGQWVALRDGELLAIGPSFKDVKQQVGTLKNTRILVMKVY